MAWATTLEIADSAVPSFKIQGASVFDDYGGGGYTDLNGQLVYIVDDTFSQYGVRIGHPGSTVHAAFGYLQKTYILNKSSSAMIQTVLLQPAPDPGPSPGPQCFIVTAVTGSPESTEVMALRALRERVAQTTRLGAQLIDAIYSDYAQFSPEIAAKLEQDAVAQAAVLWIIVRPLLGWYATAGLLALDKADPSAINQAQVLASCPDYLGGESIIGLLEAIRAGEELPASTHPLLLEFAPRIQKAARLQFASWAIIDPLIRIWRSATKQRDLIDEIAGWLAAAPLDAFALPGDPANLNAEMAALAGFFDFKPGARWQLGDRLASAWPDAASALERARFLRDGRAEFIKREIGKQ